MTKLTPAEQQVLGQLKMDHSCLLQSKTNPAQENNDKLSFPIGMSDNGELFVDSAAFEHSTPQQADTNSKEI